MTGTGLDGKLISSVFGHPTRTCYDWTSSAKELSPGDTSGSASGPMCGHSWSGNWIAILPPTQLEPSGFYAHELVIWDGDALAWRRPAE